MILQEYSIRYFNEIHEKLEKLDYKSEIHGNLALNKLSFINFILTYNNLLDCLFLKFGSDLKQLNSGKNRLNYITIVIYKLIVYILNRGSFELVLFKNNQLICVFLVDCDIS